MKTLTLVSALALFTSLCLSCTTRALTTNETEFMKTILNQEIDYSQVKIFIGKIEEAYKEIKTIKEKVTQNENQTINPNKAVPSLESVGAITLGNYIYFPKSNYQEDFLKGYPKEINLSLVPLFAHEIFHVWQYQNKEKTKYSIEAIVIEWLSQDDPYNYNIDELENGIPKPFLNYRYEQQAAIFQQFISLYIIVKLFEMPFPGWVADYAKYRAKVQTIGLNPETFAKSLIQALTTDQKIRTFY